MAEMPPPEDEPDRRVAEAATAAAVRGVVGVLDFEFADNVTGWTRRISREPSGRWSGSTTSPRK